MKKKKVVKKQVVKKPVKKQAIKVELEKPIEKRVKTETFISLQNELIRQEERRIKAKKNKEQIKKDERLLKRLYGDLGYHTRENNKSKEKLEKLKKEVNRKNISKVNIKKKLSEIKKLENLVKSKEISKTELIDGKRYFKFDTNITKDEISRIKGNNFTYYINDIFNNVLKIKNTDIKGDTFQKDVLAFIEKGLMKEQKNLKELIKKAKKEKDKKKQKGLEGSLYGIEKQLEKVYANQDAMKLPEEEREEFLEDAIDETEAPIIVDRKNNIIRILG